MRMPVIDRMRANSNDLIRSKLYTDENFYKAFMSDLSKCTDEVLIKSPFMTTRRVRLLLPVLLRLRRKGVRITIHTRDPQEGDSMRLDAHKVLSMLLSNGIHVVFIDKLHRKIAILDNKNLWEGSLNILSQNNSREMMRRSVSKDMVKYVKNMI